MTKKELEILFELLTKFLHWRYPEFNKGFMGGAAYTTEECISWVVFRVEHLLSNYERFFTEDGKDLEDTYFTEEKS